MVRRGFRSLERRARVKAWQKTIKGVEILRPPQQRSKEEKEIPASTSSVKSGEKSEATEPVNYVVYKKKKETTTTISEMEIDTPYHSDEARETVAITARACVR